MRHNNSNQTPYSLFLGAKSNKICPIPPNWLLANKSIRKISKDHLENELCVCISKEIIPSELMLDKYKSEADKGISRIQDPLWQRVCIDILRILGPIAFQDVWKSRLINVSPQGRKVCLACPNQAIAETIEKYHFVFIDVLKQFYPFLSSLELEIS